MMFSIIKQFVTGNVDIPTVTNLELKELIVKQLGRSLVSNLIILSDETYSLIEFSKVQQLYTESGILLKKYHNEKYDCDDFSVSLKSFVADKQRESWDVIYPYAFGLLYGNLPKPHAINWFVETTKRLYFIEPQTGQIWSPSGQVFFIYT